MGEDKSNSIGVLCGATRFSERCPGMDISGIGLAIWLARLIRDLGTLTLSIFFPSPDDPMVAVGQRF